jgi:hypothetical protein
MAQSFPAGATIGVSTMSWFAYQIPPIDIGWDFLPTVKEFASRLGAQQALFKAEHGRQADEGLEITLDEFLSRWESAQSAASAVGWDGDFRREPVVFLIPDETNFEYGFVIKQDNNGSTFVMSPVHLPHLA